MNIVETSLPGALILEPRLFADERGFFLETYNQRVLAEQAGITESFVQDNHSRSARNVLRGLHYQIQQAQGKLVRVLFGSVIDVCVDIRRSSPVEERSEAVGPSAPPSYGGTARPRTSRCGQAFDERRLLNSAR